MRENRWRKQTVSLATLFSIFLLTFPSLSPYLHTAEPNKGLKYFRNFTIHDYQKEPQNWSITQDKSGIIYAGNLNSLLEYDGKSWKSIAIPNHNVFSLACPPGCPVYIGGLNEIGFVDTNAPGKHSYTSLVDHINPNKRNFGNIWKTHFTTDGIFFRSSTGVFYWNPNSKQLSIELEIEPGNPNKFNGSFTCGDHFFVKQMNTGLWQKKENTYIKVPGSGILDDIGVIFMMEPLSTENNTILVGTREKGFFIYDGKHMLPFPSEAEDFLNAKKANHGIRLSQSPGCFAVATLLGGILVINSQGQIIYHFDKESGLPDNNAKYLFEDANGNLWAALNTGITKIEYASPLSVYADQSGLPGMVYTVTGTNGRIYAGTSQGLFTLAADSSTFVPVPGIDSACWSLLPIEDSVLVATDVGVFQVFTSEGNRIKKIIDGQSYVLKQSSKYPRRTWVGTRDSLLSLYYNTQTNTWAEEYRFDQVDLEVRTIAEDKTGTLWLGTLPGAVMQITFSNLPGTGPQSQPAAFDYTVKRFGSDSACGLPAGVIQVFRAAGHVMFGTKQGLYCFDETNGIFFRDETLGQAFSQHLDDVYQLVEDDGHHIWLHVKGRNYRAVNRGDNTYDIDHKLLARVPLSGQVNAIYPETRAGVTWFATHEGLVRCDLGLAKQKLYCSDFHTIIRTVTVNGQPYPFNGKAQAAGDTPGEKQSAGKVIGVPVFTYDQRNIRFEFAAPFFEAEDRTVFACRLEGYDKEWLALDKENFKDYTHLDAGLHTFKARACNIYGDTSTEATYRFRILPPWYRTWWAYTVFFILFSGALFGVFQWRSSRLKQKRLEALVAQRTEEVNRKNQQLQEQTLLLTEQAEKLKELDHAKSRFFANISHEFRTPLTLITGPLDHLLSSRPPAELQEPLDMMYRNSQRLLSLINRLLDLSKIDSGEMKLQAAQADIVLFVKGMTANFEQAAREKQLHLEFTADNGMIPCYFDAEKMEDILVNLLSNAVKFTPPDGKITISIRQYPAAVQAQGADVSIPLEMNDNDFPNGFLEIAVEDTGSGIPQAELLHIFDRFFQVEAHERKYKGSGIGLALTRELVTLHRGKIDVYSKTGKNSGTRFILRFPLGKDHLKPEEIVIPGPGEQANEQVPQAARGSFEKSPLDATKLLDNQSESQMSTAFGPDAEPGRGKKPKSEKQTILVVEDNADMRRFICRSLRALENAGIAYEAVEAADGAEGLKKAGEIIPDLVISDIMMPVMDGLQFCAVLKKDIDTSHIPVILLTARAGDENELTGLENGADDYITKPFNEKILLIRIKNMIERRRRLQLTFQRMLMEPEEIEVTSPDHRFLQRLKEIMEKRLSDTQLNVESLSDLLEMSRVTLNKKIQALTGEKANEFIRTYRLNRSLQLLQEGFGSIIEVSLEVGFENHSYFTKCFKEKFGKLPSEHLPRKM